MRRTQRPGPVEDLREKLNRKRQQKQNEDDSGNTTRLENKNGPPPDPPSLLKDPLRGDNVTGKVNKREYRSRGFPRQGRRYSRGRPWGVQLRSHNIVVEFSTPGERTCTIDESKNVRNEMATEGKRTFYESKELPNQELTRGRGGYRRSRNYRGYQRGRERSGRLSRGRQHSNMNQPEINLNDIDEQWDVDVSSAASDVKHQITPNINLNDTDQQWDDVNSKNETASDLSSINEQKGSTSAKRTTTDWKKKELSEQNVFIKETPDYDGDSLHENVQRLKDLKITDAKQSETVNTSNEGINQDQIEEKS